jgi:predicted CopG family antitoxin
MSSKNISIPESVYERLREEKRPAESFGDVIDRLLGQPSLAEFWGTWSDETTSIARETVREGRALSNERLSELTE